MDEDKWPRKILHFDVSSSYPQGCFPKRWLDNISCDVDKLQLPTSLAIDHDQKRNVVKPSRHSAVSTHRQGRRDIQLDSK